MDNGGCSKKEAALKAAKAFAGKQKILTKARKAADKKVTAAAKALRDCKKASKSGAKKKKSKKTTTSAKTKVSSTAGSSTWTMPSSSTGAHTGTARSASLADIRAGKVAKSAHGPSEGTDTSTEDGSTGSSLFTASASDAGFTASLASDGSSTDSSEDSADGINSGESEDGEGGGWMTPALIIGGIAIIGVGAFMYHKSKKNGTSMTGAVSSSASDAKKAVTSMFSKKPAAPALESTPTIHVPDEEPAY